MATIDFNSGLSWPD